MDRKYASEELAEDVRDIYLILNRNYTNYLSLKLIGEKRQVSLGDVFPADVLGSLLADMARLQGMRGSAAVKQGLSFAGDFNFTRDNAQVDQIRYAQDKVIAQMKEKIISNPHLKILSLGIGNGDTCARYATGTSAEITGLDLHMKYLDEAKKRMPGMKAVIFDLNRIAEGRIPMLDSSFDAIECTMVAHHIEDFGLLIAEAHRLLKPHGCFIYADLVDKTAPEKEMTFREAHRHPPFHGIEFFREAGKIQSIISGQLSITAYERIGPGILFLVAEK